MIDNNNPTDSKGITGLVFSIQKYSIQDGPGIRTTVFLKGCPLACEWCSNPESQSPRPEIMVRAQKCQACGTCVETCQNGAISLINGSVVIDRSICKSCFSCVETCVSDTLEITGKSMLLEDVIEEVLQDEIFYNNSGGGVTLSGGEPLSQPEFTHNFLKECKNRSLNTALDTSGFAKWETLEMMLPYTDLVLFDLKNLDPEAHLKGTKVKNEIVLDNFRKLINSNARVWVRMPVISGFNDSKQHAGALAAFLKDRPIEKISLLKYHEWGKPKYEFLGKTYPMNNTGTVQEDDLEKIKNIMEAEGLSITIGY